MNFPKLPLQISWLLWLSWTVLLCLLLLLPSDGTVDNISSFFGGTELTDTIGHVLLIFVDSLLLYNVLVQYTDRKITLYITLIVALAFGIILEIAQTWIPSRGASFVDILAAIIGVEVAYIVITHQWIRFK